MNYGRILKALRERYKVAFTPATGLQKSSTLINLQRQAVSDCIAESVKSGKPFMLSRFGSEELKWYIRYKILSRGLLKRSWSYVSCKVETWKQEDRTIDNMTFVPRSLEMTEYFIREMDMAIPQIDLLGSWLAIEQSPYVKRSPSTAYAFLVDLEPYYHPNPWSAALKGKKVLVVHPMTESIARQYEKRTLLFEDPRVLPDFDLLLLKAKYFDDPVYNTWEKIYRFYLEEIHKTDFDVALLGCGSWGMPLAARIKEKGKVAIHLGGATQLLFGITGNRWEVLYPTFTKKFVNAHWAKPLESETPSWAVNYDKQAYW